MQNVAIETLSQDHKSLGMELQRLARRAYLTPAEQDRARVLKKLKLRLKDRIHQLVR